MRDADRLVPDRLGLVVAEVDGEPDAVAVEARAAGDELPRPRDGVGLEVVAEAPVAEHLEEREVAAGAADLVDVVVLAGQRARTSGSWRPGAGRTDRLLAEEVRDELHHPRVREHRARSGASGSGSTTAPGCGRASAKNSFQARRSPVASMGFASLPVGGEDPARHRRRTLPDARPRSVGSVALAHRRRGPRRRRRPQVPPEAPDGVGEVGATPAPGA